MICKIRSVQKRFFIQPCV